MEWARSPATGTAAVNSETELATVGPSPQPLPRENARLHSIVVATGRRGLLARVRVGHPGLKIVGDCVVREEEGDLAKAKQVLEHVLRHQPREDGVGRGERRGAHARPFVHLLLDGSRLEPARPAGDDELDVARHGVVGDHGVHERHLKLLAYRLHHLPRGEIVDAAEDEVDRRLAVDAAVRDRVLQLGPVLVVRDVHVVHFKDGVRAQLRAVVPRRHRLVPSGLLRAVEHFVHICELDRVVVVDEHLADAAAREHLAHADADATNTDNRNAEVAHAFVVADHAHRLERHQPRVGVCVDHLG
mmetsp:Transcript_12531/g.39463  ORF Transcript_12531/g.39463 Transcript_12531/m.39463 type:complete len:302 (-) Transcript_12531:239-1144(-)